MTSYAAFDTLGLKLCYSIIEAIMGCDAADRIRYHSHGGVGRYPLCSGSLIMWMLRRETVSSVIPTTMQSLDVESETFGKELKAVEGRG